MEKSEPQRAVVLAAPAVPVAPARLDDLLVPGVVVTTADGQVRTTALGLDERVLLEERDLVDPVGRIRVERLSQGPLRWSDPRRAGWGADVVEAVPILALRPEPVAEVSAAPVTVLAQAPMAEVGEDRLLGWLVAVSVGGAGPEGIDELAVRVAGLLADRAERLRADNARLAALWEELVAAGPAESGRSGPGGAVALGGREVAALLGWEDDQPLIVLAVALDPVRGSGRPDAAVRERFAWAWRTELEHSGAPARLVDLGDVLMVLLPVTLVPGVDELVDAVSVGRPFSVGVSRVVAGLGQVSGAADEAERALRVGQDRGGRATTYFQRLGLDRLLALVPEPEAAAYAADLLGPLAADTTEAADLRRTLQLLLDTGWNIAEAARLQYLHYTTVRFRVTKFERWLGPLADDPARRLDVAVALRILGAWTSPTPPTSQR